MPGTLSVELDAEGLDLCPTFDQMVSHIGQCGSFTAARIADSDRAGAHIER